MDFIESSWTTTKRASSAHAMNEILRDWYVGDIRRCVRQTHSRAARMSDYIACRSKIQPQHRHTTGFRFDLNGMRCQNSNGVSSVAAFGKTPKPAQRMAEPIHQPGKFARCIAPPRRGIINCRLS
jgi:hypothetical protein